MFCDYPLLLGCHMHHVIASDDKGPDHPLNLIGLCANHHTVLECVRRYVGPKEARRSNNWLQRGLSALKFIEALSIERRKLFHHLAEPHPLKREIQEGVEYKWQTALAADIAQADMRMLFEVNKARLRIVLLCRIGKGEVPEPKTDAEWASAIKVVRKTLCPADFREVVSLHLASLGLPFDAAWLGNKPPF